MESLKISLKGKNTHHDVDLELFMLHFSDIPTNSNIGTRNRNNLFKFLILSFIENYLVQKNIAPYTPYVN